MRHRDVKPSDSQLVARHHATSGRRRAAHPRDCSCATCQALARFRQPQLLAEPEPASDPLARPRRRAAAAASLAARPLTPFERELLEAPCRRHSSLAVCDECTPPRAWDSSGFPGAVFAAGRGRYRSCRVCRKLYAISEWNFTARSCQGCAGEVGGATPAVAKPTASPRPENHRRFRV